MAGRYHSRSVLAAFAALSLVLAAVELGAKGWPASAAIDVEAAAACAAILMAVHRHRPRRPAVWYVLGLSIPLFTLGGLLHRAVPSVPAHHPALYALPNGLFLSGFACLFAGLLGASLCRVRSNDRSARLDTGILLTAVGVMIGVLVVEPLLASSRLSGVVRLVYALYPALDIGLVVVALHLLLADRERPWALWGIAAATATGSAADLVQAVAATYGTTADLTLLSLGWLMSSAVLGLAALHPSMRRLTEPLPPHPVDLRGGRTVSLGLALFAAPAAVTVSTVFIHAPFDPTVLLVPSGILTLLVLLRLRRLFLDKQHSEILAVRDERRFRALVENLSDHVLVVSPDGTVAYQSPSLARLLGYAPDTLIGTPAIELILASDRAAMTLLMRKCGNRPGEPVHGKVSGIDATGRVHRFEITMTNLIDDEAVRGVVGVMHDVTERDTFEEELRYQALHDPLTGLPNRTLVLDRAERMLRGARQSQGLVAAFFVDIDNFKTINDSLGHVVGDELLRAIATRLRQSVRAADTVGRLGGDEFLVLVGPNAPIVGHELVAERIAAVLRAPFEIDGRRCVVHASIGIAVEAPATADELLRDADVAMYRAKAEGKDRYVVFLPEMRAAAQRRLELEMDLPNALREGQFQLVYQPLIRLRSLTVDGVEALVRWRHPVHGTLFPDAFIPLAEETGFIVDIGRFVLREACRTAAGWATPEGPLSVAINVSAVQMDSEGFVDDVRRALAESGIEPGRLILEITETNVMKDAEVGATHIAALKALGVRVAIDDFGTGYSSLSYLRRFPIDIVKIDRSFIASIRDSSESIAVVRTLIHLGKTLNLEIVAEGVEQETEFHTVRQEACDHAQGYLFARPLEPEQVEGFLRTWKYGCESERPTASVSPADA